MPLISRYRDHGIEPAAFEGSVPVTDKTRLALEGRDEEIEEFCTLLRNLGELGVEVVCYDWMAGLRWARTSTTTPARGGSLTTSYDDDLMRRGPTPAAAETTTAEDLWENLEYSNASFLSPRRRASNSVSTRTTRRARRFEACPGSSTAWRRTTVCSTSSTRRTTA